LVLCRCGCDYTCTRDQVPSVKIN
jgi:hypothetical protein